MIVHGYEQLEIGKKYTRVVQGPDNNEYMITFTVMRESNIEELIEYCREMNTEFSSTKHTGPHFYKVMSD